MCYIFCGSTLHLNTHAIDFLIRHLVCSHNFFSKLFFNSVIYFLFYACLKNLHENEQNCVSTNSFVINNLLKLL
jgi:hypothetical protein